MKNSKVQDPIMWLVFLKDTRNDTIKIGVTKNVLDFTKRLKANNPYIYYIRVCPYFKPIAWFMKSKISKDLSLYNIKGDIFISDPEVAKYIFSL